MAALANDYLVDGSWKLGMDALAHGCQYGLGLDALANSRGEGPRFTTSYSSLYVRNA